MNNKLYETYRRIEREHWWFIGRQRILFDVLKRAVSSNAKLLDVGCNTGVLVSLLQEKGYKAFGTDLSPEAIEYGNEHGVKNLLVATANTQPFANETFDAVLTLDVIEHIDDDYAAVAEMNRVLKPGGILVVMVPAFKFLWGLQDVVAHHKRRYSKGALIDVLQKQGFDICHVTYFNSFLFLPIAAVRLWQKIVAPKRSSDFDLNNHYVNKILSRIFIIESMLLRSVNFPAGVSLLAVAKKQ